MSKRYFYNCVISSELETTMLKLLKVLKQAPSVSTFRRAILTKTTVLALVEYINKFILTDNK